MDKYPIKPGTVVTIPKQPERKKQPDRRASVTPEQRIKTLIRRIRVLSWILTLSIALLVALGALTYSLLQETDEEPAIGQNYSYESLPEEEPDPSQEGNASQTHQGDGTQPDSAAEEGEAGESTGETPEETTEETTEEADVSHETISKSQN